VSKISACDIIPATGTNNNNEIKLLGEDSEFQAVGVLNIDRNFPDNLGIELVAGQPFSPSDAAAATQILVNEAMVADLGYPSADAMVGAQFETKWGDGLLVVVGVVKDFRYKLLMNEHAITPMMLRYKPGEFQYANVKIASPDVMKTIGGIPPTNPIL
jgi:putative ABC transport system permease protein